MRMKQQVRQYKDVDNGGGDMVDETEYNMENHHHRNTIDVISPQSQDSGSTWQTGVSEYTGSEVTVW
jgi:hypothetical protein